MSLGLHATMKVLFLGFLLISGDYLKFTNGVTVKQFDASLDTMRSLCQPKHKVTVEMLDDLRKGTFVEDPELKCYTRCIAQMAGTLTKKGEFSEQRVLAQINIILPEELRETARKAFTACKSVQDNYKDSCDKTFFLTKCVYEFSPKDFKFP